MSAQYTRLTDADRVAISKARAAKKGSAVRDPVHRSEEKGKDMQIRPIDQARDDAMAKLPNSDDPDAWVRFWLGAALTCKAFLWDPDQREAAESNLRAAIAKAEGGTS